ncbi:MAG TPA: amino acid ABC transporter ATP-binding protein [Myxococcaceae bacterium]|nr:amino acid ABC transporter ATP-binding protein [Myxococcaceae bacterium]
MKLVVKDITRRHPGAAAAVLDGLSFELEGGTLVAMLGPSGSGKTTFLRCLIGLEPFERGEIVAGDDVVLRGTEQSSPAERRESIAKIRARIGLVFQSFELFPHLSAVENCTLAPVRVKGVARADAEAKAVELLTRLGLAERLKAHPDQLSGGQRQRVAIARALAMEPKILLYDEPTSALDPSMKQEVLQTLHRVDATGVTQVVVAHDLSVARGSEHVWVLGKGKLVEEGKPDEVLVSPKHEATRKLLADWK